MSKQKLAPLISSNVWLKPGILMIYGASLDAALHKHHVIQVIWPTGSAKCTLENIEINGAALINSQVSHQLNMDAGWIILVEPQSDFGKKLSERLKSHYVNNDGESIEERLDFLPLPEALLEPAVSATNKVENSRDPIDVHNIITILKPLLIALDIHTELTISNQSASITDKRIQTLLKDLDNCLISDCLKPSHWAAAEVASHLALSEGRFLHLFREQMGIAWRPYLLWRRMICAISAMMKGRSATEAAYIAGFSDSSHLSRTFRAHFGMSIRDAQALIK
jgi:AraC-like DNA-binding protein